MNYPFVYSLTNITTVNINHNFVGSILNIKLSNTHSTSFELSYASIYI